MKCPYCENIMEQGVIQSPHELSWKKKSSIIGKAEFHKDSVVLAEFTMVKGANLTAFLCRECQKIVIDYADTTSDQKNK